jgi:thioredoxin-like negative regulator of GroEL
MKHRSPIAEITAESFALHVLHSDLPVLVAVSGAGGTASQALLRLLEEWVPQARGRLQVFRLSGEGSSGVAERFDVPSAPSLVLFSQGAVCYQFAGEVSRGELDEVLARARLLGLARKPEAPGERRPAAGPLRSGNVAS